jgi:hypothetical protein
VTSGSDPLPRARLGSECEPGLPTLADTEAQWRVQPRSQPALLVVPSQLRSSHLRKPDYIASVEASLPSTAAATTETLGLEVVSMAHRDTTNDHDMSSRIVRWRGE